MKFEKITKCIEGVNKWNETLFNLLRSMLKQYCSDINDNFYEDWRIVELKSNKIYIILIIEDDWHDSFSYKIPKAWVNDRINYCNNIKNTYNKIHIESLKDKILEQQRILNEDTFKLSKVQKELKDFQERLQIEQIKDSKL